MSRIIHGDAFDVLADMDTESVHAVVTDPPYGLNFMGRDWDNFRRKRNEADTGRDNVFGRTSSTSPAHGAETEGRRYQMWCQEWAALALDVLKPGGHLLAFSGNRTHHRLFSGVEDAGFEVRDTLTWHYGSGFPKALDVSKAVDKQAGAESDREVVGKGRTGGGRQTWSDGPRAGRSEEHYPGEYDKTAPATDAAKEWDGWKTTLKPATEFIVLARKPFEGTVAENVQTYGTAALNIDRCRINYDGEVKRTARKSDGSEYQDNPGSWQERGREPNRPSTPTEAGRYPANVIFDEVAAKALDREVGTLDTGEYDLSKHADQNKQDKYGTYSGGDKRNGHFPADSGGPSRYFYTSKATRSERTLDGKIENPHPTVKPLDLMEWLVKLVTAEGQVVLDPFAGTGTTCRAAKNLGREFLGIEKQTKWADVARARCGLDVDDPDLLTPEEQATLADGGISFGGGADGP